MIPTNSFRIPIRFYTKFNTNMEIQFQKGEALFPPQNELLFQIPLSSINVERTVQYRGP